MLEVMRRSRFPPGLTPADPPAVMFTQREKAREATQLLSTIILCSPSLSSAGDSGFSSVITLLWDVIKILWIQLRVLTISALLRLVYHFRNHWKWKQAAWFGEMKNKNLSAVYSLCQHKKRKTRNNNILLWRLCVPFASRTLPKMVYSTLWIFKMYRRCKI